MVKKISTLCKWFFTIIFFLRVLHTYVMSAKLILVLRLSFRFCHDIFVLTRKVRMLLVKFCVTVPGRCVVSFLVTSETKTSLLHCEKWVTGTMLLSCNYNSLYLDLRHETEMRLLICDDMLVYLDLRHVTGTKLLNCNCISAYLDLRHETDK